ncbi:hypothetical protein EUX98_g7862 [Antrodiella citrinella]|uniref:Uncharacterized protein n=1 Tax=Antrodiella citrinella TaxID=2447956 RepID=A0A4S4MMD4_9APHY|nr:hypothetical protein EUX98_g7862 [Antrodiella citrinella]
MHSPSLLQSPYSHFSVIMSNNPSTLPIPLQPDEVMQLRFTELQLSIRAKELLHQSQLSEMGATLANLSLQLDEVKQHVASDVADRNKSLRRLEGSESRLDTLHRKIHNIASNLSATNRRTFLQEKRLSLLRRDIQKVAQSVRPPVLLGTGRFENVIFPEDSPAGARPTLPLPRSGRSRALAEDQDVPQTANAEDSDDNEVDNPEEEDEEED